MILVTAVGEDRPGMVHALASLLGSAGCNIEDTTMTRLSGEFAMIVVVSPPPSIDASALSSLLAPLEASHGLFINCKSFRPPAPSGAAASRFVVSVYGPENVGLVAAISGVLAELGVNITDVQTRVASGGALYIMLFEIELPPSVDRTDLEARLAHKSQEIGLELSLRPLDEEIL